ncbi:MAG: PEP-CTERM sorting domain-containing protein, partial [Bythopirellula sp.]
AATIVVMLATIANASLNGIAHGDFENDLFYDLGGGGGHSDSSVGTTPAGTDWYESDTTTFGDMITNTGNAVFVAQFEDNGNVFLMNNNANYIYQSLGTLGTEASADFTFDAYERAVGNGDYTVTIDLFAGTFGGAGTGSDVAGAGLTPLGSGSYSFLADNVVGGADASQAGSILGLSLAGATAGDEVWVRVSRNNGAGTSTSNIDNLTVRYTEIPEPSTLALLALTLAGVAGVRRMS